MHTGIKNQIKIVLLVLSCWGLWACDERPSDSKAVNVARGTSVQILPVGGNNANGIGSWGIITSTYQNEFNLALKALISATTDPNVLGPVDPRNGVLFQGYILASANGTVDLANSKLRIEIWDSYAVSGQSGQIPINFQQLRSGQVTNNQVVLHFEDQYGAIVFQGQHNGQTITGTVSFTNYTYFNNQQQPKTGILGEFSIPYCYLITCN